MHVATPEREVWSGRPEMVVAKGVEGEVGILAGHAPMLIRLAVGSVRCRGDGADETIVVDGGFLHVTTSQGATRVDVLATSASRAGELDPAAVRSEVDEARRRAAQNADDDEARERLARAEARAAAIG